MFSNQRKVGLGVMIHDSVESVIAALSSPMVGSLGARETEAKAMEIGMRLAQDVGIQDAIFESNSLEVYNAVQGTATPSSSIQFIVDGIHQQAACSDHVFSHAPKDKEMSLLTC